MSARTFKLIGAAGAAALAIGTVAGPAVAAGEETADVTYSCDSPVGPLHPSSHYAVDAPPAKMAAGQTVSLNTTGKITLDATTTGAALTVLMWDQFNGTITTAATNAHVGQNVKITKTALNNNGDGTTTANLSGNTLIRSTKVGTYSLNLGDIGKAHLNGFNSGAGAGSIDLPDGGSFGQCTNDATSTPLQDSSAVTASVAVVKDKTTTAVAAAYNAKKNIATGTAKVKSRFGIRATGKVAFVLKKGTRTIAKATGKLSRKGVATAAFTGVKKPAKYKIVATYAGAASLKGSSGSASFTVR